MDTKTENTRDEQTTEDTAGHAFDAAERRVAFPDLLGNKVALDLLAKKRLVRELPPGAGNRGRIAG